MRASSSRQPRLTAVCLLAMAAFVLVSLVGPTTANAQQEPTVKSSGGDTIKLRRVDPPTAGCGDAKPTAVKGKPGTANIRSASKRQNPLPTLTGPPPKLVCEQDTIELQPLWAGQPMQVNWTVKNDGQGPVNIRVKGG